MSDSSGTNSWTLVTPEETAAESLRSHTELAEQHEGSNTSTAEHTGCTSSVEGSVMTSELPVDERQVSEDQPDLGEPPSPDAILTPTPITEDPTPITEDHSPSTEDHTPSTEDHTPSTEDHTLSTEDHTPSTEDPSPITEDPSPITEDHTPITEDHTPINEDPTDGPTPGTTDPTHMTPDPPHTLVTDEPRPPSSLHFPGHSSDGDAHSQSEGLPEGRTPPSPEPDTFSDSYTHISPSPEEPPASMLTPETLGGEELVQEGGATEHQPLEGEGLGQEEEESELSPRVTDLGKQADPTMDSEGWEEEKEEKEEGDAGLRKRRTLLTTLERIGRSDEEEDAEEEEEEESQPPHREEEFSFSLNKCILGAIILLGIGTIFFSEAEYEAYRELRDAQIPVKQEWSNTEGHPSLADDADLLNKLDKGTEPTSDLHAQLQAQREELKVAQGQAMEGAKELLQREVVEEEEENDLPPGINSEDPLGVPDPQLKTHGLDGSSATSSSSSSSSPSPSPHPLADGAPPPPDTEAAEPPAGHTGDSSQEAHSRKAEKEKKQKDKKKDKYDTGEKEGKEREKKEREKTEKRKEKKEGKEREKRKYEEERGKEGKEWQNKEKKKQKKEWKEKVEWKKRDDKGKQWKGGEGKKEWEEKRDERKDRKKDKQEKWSNSGKEGRGKEEWKDEKKGRKEHQEWKEERGWKKGREESGKGGKEKEEKKHWKNRNDRDEEKEWKETNEKKHGGGKGEWKKEERRKDGGRFDKDKHDKHHHDNRHDHRDDHHDHRHDDHHGHRDDNVWHAGKGGSSRQSRPSMEHPGYWLHQRHKLQRNASPPQLRCDSLETCAQAQGLLQPVHKDQFQAVLQGYLAKAEAAGVEASRTEELRKLASEFFPDGVFAHNLMSFRDFTEDLADILEDMVEEEEEEEEEKEEEEEEEDSALEQEMDGFEEEVMQRFGVVAVAKEGGKGKRGERKMERGRG